MAPLKRDTLTSRVPAGNYFHNEKVMAPLKQKYPWNGDNDRFQDFHNEKVMAPLKHHGHSHDNYEGN